MFPGEQGHGHGDYRGGGPPGVSQPQHRRRRGRGGGGGQQESHARGGPEIIRYVVQQQLELRVSIFIAYDGTLDNKLITKYY